MSLIPDLPTLTLNCPEEVLNTGNHLFHDGSEGLGYEWLVALLSLVHWNVTAFSSNIT